MAGYDPLTAAMPSKKLIIARARRRAHADTLAKLAALPDANTLRLGNASLVSSLQNTIGDQSRLVGGIQNSYAQGTAQEAAQQRGAAAATGYGAEPVASASRSGLLAMLGASQVGALQGNVGAAQAALPGQLNELAGKQGAVRAGENSLFEQYYQQGLDDALKTSAARQNAALASQGLDLKAQTAANSAALSAERNQIARDRLNASLQSTTDKSLQAAMKDAAKAMNSSLAGKGTSKVANGGTYHFQIPSALPGGKPFAKDVTARNGAEAEAAFIKWATEAGKSGHLNGYNFNYQAPGRGRDYFASMDPIYRTVQNKGSRSDALHAAMRILEAAGMTHALALSTARSWLPKPVKKKKTKAGQGNSGRQGADL